MTQTEDAAAPVLLRAAGTGLLLDVAGPLLPRVLHWGADPGDLAADQLRALARAVLPAVPHSSPDQPVPLTLLPGEPDGWSGRPGLAGHRDPGSSQAERAAAVHPRLRLTGTPAVAGQPDGAQLLVVAAADPAAGLSTRSELRLEPSGLVRIRHAVTNTGSGDYLLAGLTALLPVPAEAGELLDLTGRWCRERSPQRLPMQHGQWLREGRRGRSGHDAPLLLAAGVPGFGFRRGAVWATHVAWSGNHQHLAERLPEGAGAGGAAVIGGGELLLPGEVVLAPGQTYTGPWVLFSWSGDGLDGISARVHRWLRARPEHPTGPRPLVLNTWEAVFFDHSLDRLTELARTAADLGVERFVLDDGWFTGRRHDRAGLGDWFVDPAVWPDGLRPLADQVRALGMEFGLWVEPEMVSPDSDLVRAHPDWLLAPPGRSPPLWRHQAVLDVAHPQAFDYLLDRLDRVVAESGAGYLKWDHNRDLHESVHAGAAGPVAGVHQQTLALYALLDQLRTRHPGLEIESCASGGGRVDLGILAHTDRVWASDTIDALERQSIQRWTGLLLPPELVGSHVGGPLAKTTHRRLDLGLRCLTALFGHAGLEWDVTGCDTAERDQLRRWSSAYRELRGLLHSGDVVRADHPDPGAWLHGVVSPDRGRAVYGYVRLESSADVLPGRLRLPGLDPQRSYRVTRREDAGAGHSSARQQPRWWGDPIMAGGRALAVVGLAAPALDPAQAVLLELTRV
jgi:alpha-galactosidase